MPGIDRQAIDRGLAAHRVEPGAVQQRRQQRMAGERLVEPGERGGGLRQGGGERRIKLSGAAAAAAASRAIVVPPADRPARRGAGRDRAALPALRQINGLRVSLRKPGDSVQ